ncbi:MAG TPA: phosphotransferase [Burkholderiaceae bacterium]
MTATACLSAFDSSLPEAAVLCAPAAPVSVDEALMLLRTHYGLSGTLLPLTGERDANFLLTLPGYPTVRRMLKVSHPSEDAVVTDFQTQALLHIAQTAPDLPVQRLVPTLEGHPSIAVQMPDGRTRMVRLFSYLEGLPMPHAPRSAAQSANVARTLARVDHALAGLRHAAGALELPWDIQRAGHIRGLLAHIGQPQQRALAEHALDGFELNVVPLLGTLRRQPIHNDFNIYNLLVDPTAPEQVAGILDFGDMVEAPMINDLAVAASYQIDQLGEHTGPLDAIAAFASAYHAIQPLRPTELDLLLDLIRARLTMVVAISGLRAARYPENAAYLLRNNAVTWTRLQACDAISPEQARVTLYTACGLI